MSAIETLTIERLGQRGEGIAESAHGRVYVPYALPGDTIHARVGSERGVLVDIVTPSADRIAPFCVYYGICGGCAVQALAADAYTHWKQDLVVTALARENIAVDVAPMRDAHGEGRRRATIHAHYEADGTFHVGFMQARAHAIVEIESCPLFAPDLAGALPAARAIAAALRAKAKPLDIVATATQTGLDIDLRGCGPLDEGLRQNLIGIAQTHDLARLSNHGLPLISRRQPVIAIGAALVRPVPGGFLQATQAGEDMLGSLVMDAAKGAKRVADLFSGLGAFALRLAEFAEVHAVESDAAALAALDAAARATAGVMRVTTETRDLMRRPLLESELNRYDAIVFDPPRAGAQTQAANLARSSVPKVIAVSCNVQSFARDARLLIDGGYTLDSVTPIDQFRHSAHVEMVGIFSRPPLKKRKRSLLG